MKIILWVVLGWSAFLQFDAKKYRTTVLDEIFDYDLDKRVPSMSTYLSREHFSLDHVDDDNTMGGGYFEYVKSMDPKDKVKATMRTQYYAYSKWHEGPAQLGLSDVCKDNVSPERFWYNISRLWTADVCPPQKGDRWYVNNQTISIRMSLPVLPLMHWRTYIKIFQGMPGREKHMFGFGFQLEFIEE